MMMMMMITPQTRRYTHYLVKYRQLWSNGFRVTLF